LGLLILTVFAAESVASSAAVFVQIPVGDTEFNNAQPTQAAVESAAILSAGYLEQACGPDGRFKYKIALGSGRESSSYDIIRHEGAIYALGMFNRHHSDPNAVAAMVRGATFLQRNYMGTGILPDQMVIWSKQIGSQAKTKDRYAELGGIGLGIVALAETRQVSPDTVSLNDLESLGRFLLFLQKPDGSFVNKFYEQSGPALNWSSLYYPGEAALGLIYLYELDRSPKWLEAAGFALGYLAKTRAPFPTAPADHWALIATAKLLPYCETANCGVSRQELIQHTLLVCNSILHEQLTNSSFANLDGSFDTAGRITPTATRLEALLAALEFLPEGETRTKIREAVFEGIAFLLRAQIQGGPQAGGVPGSADNQVRSSLQIRIDFVQHALCAWIRYQQIFSSSAQSIVR